MPRIWHPHPAQGVQPNPAPTVAASISTSRLWVRPRTIGHRSHLPRTKSAVILTVKPCGVLLGAHHSVCRGVAWTRCSCDVGLFSVKSCHGARPLACCAVRMNDRIALTDCELVVEHLLAPSLCHTMWPGCMPSPPRREYAPHSLASSLSRPPTHPPTHPLVRFLAALTSAGAGVWVFR